MVNHLSVTVPGVVMLVVLIALSLMLSISHRRGRGPRGAIDREFVTRPAIAWFITIGSLFLLTANLVSYFHLFTSKPAPNNVPIFIILGDVTFIGFAVLGIYYKTLKICVDDKNLCVSSLFGSRKTPLRYISSVVVKNNGQWRTMDVHDARGRRVLYTTSSLRDFDDLADVLSDAAAGSPAP